MCLTPRFLHLNPGEEYKVDSIYIVSSTDPNWRSIRLTSSKEVIELVDTVTLSGPKLKNLKAGHDYTFHMAFVGESAEDKCNRGYTYFTLRIVPDVVTWQGGEWNQDSNWDSFIPMRETTGACQYSWTGVYRCQRVRLEMDTHVYSYPRCGNR